MAQLKISETQRTKGVILALLSTLSFSFMMIFAALNSPEISLWEQTFFRNLIGIFVASFILIKNHQPLFGERKYWPQMFARSLFGLLAVMLLFYASRNALQADVSIMNRISMFTISIVSVVFLHERLTKPSPVRTSRQTRGLIPRFCRCWLHSAPRCATPCAIRCCPTFRGVSTLTAWSCSSVRSARSCPASA